MVCVCVCNESVLSLRGPIRGGYGWETSLRQKPQSRAVFQAGRGTWAKPVGLDKDNHKGRESDDELVGVLTYTTRQGRETGTRQGRETGYQDRVERPVPDRVERPVPDRVERPVPDRVERPVPDRVERPVPDRVSAQRKRNVLCGPLIVSKCITIK